jgi:dienelactone hydrolase
MLRLRSIATICLLSGWGVLPRTSLGAETIYASVCREARQVSAASVAQPLPPAPWKATVAQRRQMWHEMLGLSPMPERTPLAATVTGTLQRGDYVVEKIHFQSVPGAYVIGNIYRPAKSTGRLPAVLYLCGHSKGKVNPPYQANPRWFGQHGYVALVLDPIQLGESQGLHHGTYREGRWDWPSRGYTPAGTEVWNAMRALDYLETRPDVDKDRMGVTGLSGGGVISWCLGAADERVKVVVPVCQTGSIEHVVVDRATDGHCDCAFWINYYRWCWPDLGALIAPRALLIASGSEDVLWRPYGYRDVAHRIRHQYTALGAPAQFALVEDFTPHGYTPTPAAGANASRAASRRPACRHRGRAAPARNWTGGRVRPGRHRAAGHLRRHPQPSDRRGHPGRSACKPRGPEHPRVSRHLARRRPAAEPGAGLSPADHFCGGRPGRLRVDPGGLQEAGGRRSHPGHCQRPAVAASLVSLAFRMSSARAMQLDHRVTRRTWVRFARPGEILAFHGPARGPTVLRSIGRNPRLSAGEPGFEVKMLFWMMLSRMIPSPAPRQAGLWNTWRT